MTPPHIDSIEEEKNGDEDIYSAPLSIKELHEFLMIEGIESVPESLELRALNACPVKSSEAGLRSSI